MTWTTIFQTIFLIAGSLGGASAFALGVVKWGAEILSQRILSDIDHRHEKNMEEYKAQLAESNARLNTFLQNSAHIAQHQYDLEMDIYRKIWGALINLMECIEWTGNLKILNKDIMNENELKKQRKAHLEQLAERLDLYQKLADANAPFYQKDAYVVLEEIASQFQKIQEFFIKYEDEIIWSSDSDFECMKNICNDVISKKIILTEIVRDYLNSLKILNL